MVRLSVSMLGPLDVQLDGEAVTNFESDKIRALLAYLIVENSRPHPRESLAEFLWPERPLGAGLSNLRHALSVLRRAIGDRQATPSFLLVTRQSIQFNSASDAWADVIAFSRAISRSPDSPAGRQALEATVQLVRGPFLDGLSAGDSLALEEWLLLRREHYHAEQLQALSRLTTNAEVTGEYKKALHYARRQVEISPWNELAHQQLMRSLALNDRQSEALAQFEICRRQLAEELAVEPSPETVALYKAIEVGEIQPPLSELQRQHIRGYELGEYLGAGHVGAVYRAYQPVVARDVAIKIILPQFASRPGFIRRFEAEARIVARLEHPHIVPLYDFWREPQGAYLVMRWLRGGSLAARLAKGSWALEPSARLVDQIAVALTAAHMQGVVHRDVKPANILLDEAGNAYLSDFGIATMIGVEGSSDQPAPATSTSSLGYLSPEAARGEALTAATDVYSLGVLIFEMLTGRHPFPNLTPESLMLKHMTEPLPRSQEYRPDLPAAVDEVIQKATAKAPRERYSDASALARAFRHASGIGGDPSLTLVERGRVALNPYRGLQSFQEADAPYFFGREELTRRLVHRLSETTEGSRFLAVVGPSGSGKSSAVNAGLLPALREGAAPGSNEWLIVKLLPGTHPYEDLSFSLLSVAAESQPDLMTILQRDGRGLLTAAEAVLPDEDSELLLIIDQFETIFDSAVCPVEREQFLEQINTAVHHPESRLRIVVVLRADFYDRPLASPGFSRLLGRRTETVGMLTAGELLRAIEEPAKQAGVVCQPGLVTRIVADGQEQPGALPMLQYALSELFEQRQGRWLQLEAYRKMGGLSGALVQAAETHYHDLDLEGQKAARQLFLRLVSLGGAGTGVPQALAIRRRVSYLELESLHDPRAWVEEEPAQALGVHPTNGIGKVIEKFGAARLLTFDREPATREPTVEVAHEALIREWPRLRSWIDENRENLRMQRLLAQAAQEWLAAGQDASFLLRGSRLDQFERWSITTDLALTEAERSYLDKALDERSARRREEANRREHEAALERRSRSSLRLLAGVLAVAAIVALLLMLFAFGQLREAQEAHSLSLIAHAQQALSERDTATALALAQAASQITNPHPEVYRALVEAAYAPGARQRYEVAELFPGVQGPVWSLALNPDGQTALIGLADGVIIHWDWNEEVEILRLNGHTGQVNDLRFGPDGRTAISGGEDGLVMQWDLATSNPVQQLIGHAGPVQAIDVSAEGRWAISGGYSSQSFSDPGELILWDLMSGQEIRRFDGHKAGLVEAHFALDDTAILASSGDAELLTDLGVEAPGQDLQVQTILWDVASGENLADLTSFGHDAYSMAVSSSDQRALIGSYYDNVTSVIDLRTGETLLVLEGHRDAVSTVQLCSDSQRALTGSHDGSLIFWDLATQEAIVQLKMHQGVVSEVVVTPDCRSALSASRDGSLIRWDLHDAADLQRYSGHGDMVYDVAHLPDGDRFLSVSGGSNPATPSQDSSVRLWDVDTGQQLQAKAVPLEVLFQVEVTPDGNIALIAGMAPSVLVLDAATLADIGRLEGHEGWVTAIDISPDGQQAVTASVDGKLILWDLTDLHLVRKIETGMPGLWAVAISPDGRSALADTAEGAMDLWDLQTGSRIRHFVLEGVTEQNGSSGLAFLPDGRSAIAQGNDGLIHHWDLESGELIRVLGQHNDIRTRIEIAPDGHLALSSGMDGVLMLWDLEKGELVRRFGTPGQMVFDIDMSPDGLTALSGSSDAAIVRWRLDNPDDAELQQWIAANRTIRELSCDERNLYQIEPYCVVERSE